MPRRAFPPSVLLGADFVYGHLVFSFFFLFFFFWFELRFATPVLMLLGAAMPCPIVRSHHASGGAALAALA